MDMPYHSILVHIVSVTTGPPSAISAKARYFVFYAVLKCSVTNHTDAVVASIKDFQLS